MARPAAAGGRPPLRPLLRDGAAFARLVPRPRSAPTPTNRNESRRVAYTSRRNTVTSAFNCGSRPCVPKCGKVGCQCTANAPLRGRHGIRCGVDARETRHPGAEGAVVLLLDNDWEV